MTTLNDLYDYGLMIYQDSDYFKFSLDSILLAEFVKYKKNDHILDLCSGNVPIPLILASKERTLSIVGVELQKEVYDLGIKSIQENALERQIDLLNEDLRKLNLSKKFDIVTCNPPYFKVSNTSQKNENPIKQIARHETMVSLNDIIKTAKNHLTETGTFYMVHRPERLLESIEILKNYKFGIRKIAFIHTKENKKAEFFLIEASNYKKDDLKVYTLNVSNLTTYQNIFKEDNL